MSQARLTLIRIFGDSVLAVSVSADFFVRLWLIHSLVNVEPDVHSTQFKCGLSRLDTT